MKKILLIGLIALSGCSSNCMEKLAATEAGITTAYSTTKRLYEDNVIGGDDKLLAAKTIKAANIAADNALPLCEIGDPKALDYISQAQVLLEDVKQITGDY